MIVIKTDITIGVICLITTGEQIGHASILRSLERSFLNFFLSLHDPNNSLQTSSIFLFAPLQLSSQKSSEVEKNIGG
jgi:hypothetical protein